MSAVFASAAAPPRAPACRRALSPPPGTHDACIESLMTPRSLDARVACNQHPHLLPLRAAARAGGWPGQGGSPGEARTRIQKNTQSDVGVPWRDRRTPVSRPRDFFRRLPNDFSTRRHARAGRACASGLCSCASSRPDVGAVRGGRLTSSARPTGPRTPFQGGDSRFPATRVLTPAVESRKPIFAYSGLIHEAPS